MGASLVYLEKPNKEIIFDKGENENLRFVAGSMQGWRINMVSLETKHKRIRVNKKGNHGGEISG
jgi:hypothetical protein